MNKIAKEEDMTEFKQYKLDNLPKILNQFDCDVNWVVLMNNRLFVNELGKTMIAETKNPSDFNIGGIFIYGLLQDDMTSLKDEQTVDLVTTRNTKNYISKDKNKQSIYYNLQDYMKNNRPDNSKCNIYFVGDVSGSGEFLSIHWNCFIIDFRQGKKFIWYDPSDELFEGGFSYNFNPIKKMHIANTLKMPILDLKTMFRAQQFCASHPAQDVFCQTWVFMFASAYINNLFDWFAKINYIKWQNHPLKMWIRCITSRLPKGKNSWFNELKKNYKQFFLYCRRNVPIAINRNNVIVEKLPKIIKMPPGKKKVPCIYSVIKHYIELENNIKNNIEKKPSSRAENTTRNTRNTRRNLRRSARIAKIQPYNRTDINRN